MFNRIGSIIEYEAQSYLSRASQACSVQEASYKSFATLEN